MPTASTPTLESLMHYIDRRIGEHETHIKSMLANHEAAMMQKMEEINKAMEENNKTIMEKIEAAMAMHNYKIQNTKLMNSSNILNECHKLLAFVKHN